MSRKDISDYPFILTANEISEILKISIGSAYALMRTKEFPLLEFGRCKRVLRDEFFKWLSDQ
jgi:DNA polymerase III delta prime subunit